jgi:N-succinyldiaminopimelate aminotransferase
MNSRLSGLQAYPFQKLAALLQGIEPPETKPVIRLSIGEPQHAAPAFVLEALTNSLSGLSNYPATKGSLDLRRAIVAWTNRRFRLTQQPLDAERHVLPVAGTREALFSIAQAVVDLRPTNPAIVVMPNPFYQIYEGAARLAGARPYFVNTAAEKNFKMNFDSVSPEIWRQTQLVYLCTPGNPTGAVFQHDDFARVIELSQRYGFVIASDECYSEIYFDEDRPPLGLLQVAQSLNIPDYRHCLVFNSLSKRSNLPGLRSGFVAGDPNILESYYQYRTYQGCALPPPTQAASTVAWGDEEHVKTNRSLYREKFSAVLELIGPVMDVDLPDAGFFLWARTPMDDQVFARELYAREGVVVLPGSYLSRPNDGTDPGAQRVRMALVASKDECVEAARRIRHFIESL